MGHDQSPGTDADIVSASLDKPEIFGAIYDRHAGSIHRFAARRLGWLIADDLTADVFLAAFRSRGRFDKRSGSARPWLYGIANNLIHKHRREEVRALLALSRTGRDPLTQQWTDEAAEPAAVETLEPPLALALATLANRDRDVLLLVAWADLTYDEVAQALRIPVGTVRSRLNRARGQVQKALSGDASNASKTQEITPISSTRPREAM